MKRGVSPDEVLAVNERSRHRAAADSMRWAGPAASVRTMRIAWALGLGIALALPLGGCGGAKKATADKSDSTAAAADTSKSDAKVEKAIKVDVAAVRVGEMVIPIRADGAIRTPRAVDVRTKAGGELKEVRVRDGDHVKAGQLLARIDPREYALSVEETRQRHIQALSRFAAEADTASNNPVALADFTAKRAALQDQLTRATITRAQFDAQVLELELAALDAGAFRRQLYEQRTGLTEARTSEERAKLNLENTEIRAPFAGIVEGVKVAPGEIVSVGTSVCRVYDNDELEAAVNVLEADLGNLEAGRPALLAVPAIGDTLVEAVDVISPKLDEATRTCEVIIRFHNSGGRLRPGMFVRAEIAGWIYSDKLQVPKEAVLVRDDRTLLFKVVDDRAQWLYVDTGLENEEWIEITGVHSGGSLAAGDRVVVSDHLTLAHEANLEIRRTRPPSDRWARER
jgi:multidrug efflux pump subunit AcrA (membrane-fusion protein)